MRKWEVTGVSVEGRHPTVKVLVGESLEDVVDQAVAGGMDIASIHVTEIPIPYAAPLPRPLEVKLLLTASWVFTTGFAIVGFIIFLFVVLALDRTDRFQQLAFFLIAFFMLAILSGLSMSAAAMARVVDRVPQQ